MVHWLVSYAVVARLFLLQSFILMLVLARQLQWAEQHLNAIPEEISTVRSACMPIVPIVFITPSPNLTLALIGACEH